MIIDENDDDDDDDDDNSDDDDVVVFFCTRACVFVCVLIFWLFVCYCCDQWRNRILKALCQDGTQQENSFRDKAGSFGTFYDVDEKPTGTGETGAGHGVEMEMEMGDLSLVDAASAVPPVPPVLDEPPLTAVVIEPRAAAKSLAGSCVVSPFTL